MSFSKQNAFMAFISTNKACGNCRSCANNTCHINIAKDTLTYMSQTGSKFNDDLPEDILDLLRVLPVVDGRIDRFKAVEAYDAVSKICDDCRQQDHDEFCAINITLTALGALVYGPTFITDKDKALAK
ncbi:MAG: nitrite and sulphite reductase 4Fe-4S region [Sporomusa sp.]|jgi:hypothetical protein|nr:nitrite and sulphite reductase 4Fe-4S region [Sporomusa sp.]